jgi:hypothetical protein
MTNTRQSKGTKADLRFGMSAHLPDELVCAILRWLDPVWLPIALFVSTQWAGCVTQAFSDVQSEITDGAHTRMRVTDALADTAAAKGHVSIVRWLCCVLGWHWSPRAVENAALGGHADVLDCMIDCRSASTQTTLIPPCPITRRSILLGLIGGGMPLAERLHAASDYWLWSFHDGLVTLAVALGDIHALLRLCHLGCTPSSVAVVLAVAFERDDMLDVMNIDDCDRCPPALSREHNRHNNVDEATTGVLQGVAMHEIQDAEQWAEREPQWDDTMGLVIQDALCMLHAHGSGRALAIALVGAGMTDDFVTWSGRQCCAQHAQASPSCVVYIGRRLWQTGQGQGLANLAPDWQFADKSHANPAPDLTADPQVESADKAAWRLWLTTPPLGPTVCLIDNTARLQSETLTRKQLLCARKQERRGRRRHHN